MSVGKFKAQTLKQRRKMLCYVGGARIGAVEASRRSEPSKRVVSAALFALRSGDLCYDQDNVERPSPKRPSRPQLVPRCSSV